MPIPRRRCRCRVDVVHRRADRILGTLAHFLAVMRGDRAIEGRDDLRRLAVKLRHRCPDAARANARRERQHRGRFDQHEVAQAARRRRARHVILRQPRRRQRGPGRLRAGTRQRRRRAVAVIDRRRHGLSAASAQTLKRRGPEYRPIAALVVIVAAHRPLFLTPQSSRLSCGQSPAT